jgi:hypothetical protein
MKRQKYLSSSKKTLLFLLQEQNFSNILLLLLVPCRPGIPYVRFKSSPLASDTAPDKKGLQCHCISPRLQTHSWCGRALASPRASWHRARHLTGKGFGVTTCPAAPHPLLVWEGSDVTTCGRARRPAGKDSIVTMCPAAPYPPPGTGGLWRHHVRPDPPPGRERLHYRHMSHDSRPASRCERALASSHAPWLSALETCPCIPKAHNVRLIMATPGIRSRQRIKCVQDKAYMTYG